MYLKQLLENKEVKAVRNTNAPKGVYITIARNSEGKAITTTTIYPNSPIKHKAIVDMKHPLTANQSDKWEKHEVVLERTSEENVKAAIAFISNWLTQGKNVDEKASKANTFIAFLGQELGASIPAVTDVFGFLTSCTVKDEALLVKFITTTIHPQPAK